MGLVMELLDMSPIPMRGTIYEVETFEQTLGI
jgi:hypothetical protein